MCVPATGHVHVEQRLYDEHNDSHGAYRHDRGREEPDYTHDRLRAGGW